MQLAEKLRGMPRKKLLVALLILLLLAAGVYLLLAQQGILPDVVPAPGGITAELRAPSQDAAVYRAVRDFIEALVRDDREKVLSMLTEGHAANWTQASFLFDGATLREGQRVELGQFRHSVVRYVQPPELSGETVALVTAEYTVLFMNGDVLEKEVQLEEKMGLQLYGDTWLVTADQRNVQE